MWAFLVRDEDVRVAWRRRRQDILEAWRRRNGTQEEEPDWVKRMRNVREENKVRTRTKPKTYIVGTMLVHVAHSGLTL